LRRRHARSHHPRGRGPVDQPIALNAPGGGTLKTFAGDPREADRRFVAYAAHELRGEIALQLALAEATLADPNADTAVMREMGKGVVAACERQERLLEALLTLARSECGDLRREPVDLAATATEVLRAHDHRDLRSTTALDPARTTGDPLLIERLVTNLIENAVRHNVPEGRLDVATYTAAGHATLMIANTGPVIPTGELARLFEPFQRHSSQESSPSDGVGLGLAIVQAIANAHDAIVNAEVRTTGGLRIEIGFPAGACPKPLIG
jgi:signal transduction histidine kinase